MDAITNIRQFYTPIQPAVKRYGADVCYYEWLPAMELQPFIYCYWELKTKQPLAEPFHYRVVADGCIDIFFEPGNADESFVMGFCKQYTSFPLEKTFHYVGVRFLPTMFPQLFKINAADISNRYEALQNITPAAAVFIANEFYVGINSSRIVELLNNYFIQSIGNHALDNDLRLYEALQIIFKSYGTANTQTALDTGISARQLRRLFEYYIGDTPKTFSKVVRFQNILRSKPSVQSLRQNKLFFDAGYYDQAHFIKEFKTLYGVTPTQAFGRDPIE